jgi:hypothetical protein
VKNGRFAGEAFDWAELPPLNPQTETHFHETFQISCHAVGFLGSERFGAGWPAGAARTLIRAGHVLDVKTERRAG